MYIFVALFALSRAVDVFISPEGHDYDDGTYTKPYKTIQAAINSFAKKTLPSEGITFKLFPGNHKIINKTLSANVNNLNNTNNVPIKFTSSLQNNLASIVGGTQLPVTSFRALDATKDSKQYSKIQADVRSKVKVCDLNSLTTEVNLINIAETKTTELFVDDFRMKNARYPNKDITPEKAVDSIYIIKATFTPDVSGFYRATTKKCDNQTVWQKTVAVNSKTYYIYTINGTYYLSPRSDCKAPAIADGPSWSAKRTSMKGSVAPLSNSGATGNVNLPKEGYTYRGFMFTAFSESTNKNAKTFGYNNDRISKWSSAKNLWIKGYFKYLWSDSTIAVDNINTTARTITLKSTTSYGINAEMPYFVYNLIEELDEEGEYFIDRDEKKIYVIFYKTPKEIWISHSTKEAVKIDKVNNIEFTNLNFKYFPNGFGSSNSKNLKINKCGFKHSGSNGISVSGQNSKIEKNQFYDIGTTAVYVFCGNRVTLTNGSCLVKDNTFTLFSQNHYTYTPAINLGGVGNIATHNFIEQSPHEAITFSGNNHEISYNKIENVCIYASDAGAIYTGRRWDWPGTVIKYNYIYNITGWGQSGSYVQGIYLDDILSGEKVFGNIMQSIRGRGILHGGGRDNDITNNIMYDCDYGYNGDMRGPNSYSTKTGDSWNLLEKCSEGGINRLTEPWKSAYPLLYKIPNNNDQIVSENHWLLPENCVVDCNVVYKSKYRNYNCGTSVTKNYKVFNQNLYNSSLDPLFVDPEHGDMRLKENSPVYNMKCWQDIPFDEIGITKVNDGVHTNVIISVVLLMLVILC
ncbi:hypothetical protein EIN_328960 [Entamoeba invadens IP1]|uniref:Right handed beta helix domain-containing protein n=1 Tax=Entamoeba invadens IP1 TaxID=370355 RepID=A0A0A1TXU9_ENTIV|nr:hypothetical protein EIN_328960 [Entamoeba invadens IP1]ELP86189.1 hypothetical protein EIN_328960 [Entamoeba invadens IP1]|eukprot:XP_004185535.1 hypothetical protein EIN_328960 [Entamoeba invadens IP1]